MGSLIQIVALIANLIFWLVLIQFIIGILIQFEVLNRRQPLVMQIYGGINAILDPILAPIRRILPPAGGLDFSPLVLLIGLQVLLIVLTNNSSPSLAAGRPSSPADHGEKFPAARGGSKANIYDDTAHSPSIDLRTRGSR